MGTETRYAFRIVHHRGELIRWHPSQGEAIKDASSLLEREYGGARLVSVVRDESYAPVSVQS